MTLPQIISRNQVQKTNKRAVFRQDVANHPITYYTCPAGKIAVIKGNIICSSTGAATTVDLLVDGISICEWQSAGGGTDINVPQDLALGTLFPFEVNLVATDTLASAQNSGSNANLTLNITIEEFNI